MFPPVNSNIFKYLQQFAPIDVVSEAQKYTFLNIKYFFCN